MPFQSCPLLAPSRTKLNVFSSSTKVFRDQQWPGRSLVGGGIVLLGPVIGTMFQMTKNVFEFNLNLIKQT